MSRQPIHGSETSSLWNARCCRTVHSCPETARGRHARLVPSMTDPSGASPTIVRERLVGFSHPVRVFLLLDRVSLAL